MLHGLSLICVDLAVVITCSSVWRMLVGHVFQIQAEADFYNSLREVNWYWCNDCILDVGLVWKLTEFLLGVHFYLMGDGFEK